MYNKSILLIVALLGIIALPSTQTIAVFAQTTTNSKTAPSTEESELQDILTRDQITVLLEDKSVSPKAHIHLYDTGSFHIMDGHVSVNIPCDGDQPLLEVLGGIAGDRTYMKPLGMHPVADMSITGVTCMYHTDVASVMGPDGWLITDVVLHNPSDREITFPQDSVAIVGVNEIMKDPGQAPESQGSMSMEERGGGISQMTNMTSMHNMSSTSTS